jgi:hypothetical protein
MLRKCLSLLTILAAFAAVYVLNIRLTPNDLLFYRKLVQESLDLHATSSLERSPVQQQRERVRKDVWRVKEGERVHTSIFSAHSEVTLSQKKEGIEAVEILSGVEAWTDSEDHFSAEQSTFHYPSGLVSAKDLTIDFGDVRCNGVEAEWTNKTIQFFGAFQLSHPKGILYGEKASFTEDGHFLCLFPQGELTDKTVFNADVGRAECEAKTFHPKTLILEGNVKIASILDEKESFAEADSAICQVEDKKITLQSVPESRVLFKQGGLEINAPTVYIQDTIQGAGDVRAHYSLEKPL